MGSKYIEDLLEYEPPMYYGDSLYDNWISYWEDVARYYPSDYNFRKFWHDRWFMEESLFDRDEEKTRNRLRKKYLYPSFAPDEEVMRENVYHRNTYTLEQCPKCGELIRCPI